MSSFKQKKVQLSTTCFLRFEDECLFVFRNKNPKKVDYMRLNGVGGKLEPEENFLQCAIREIKEETGYQVKPNDCRLLAMGHLSGGYDDDWVISFFEIKVESKEVPIGLENEEGKLIWIKISEFLNDTREKVDDLNYIWPKILEEPGIGFFSAKLDKNEKIEELEWLKSK